MDKKTQNQQHSRQLSHEEGLHNEAPPYGNQNNRLEEDKSKVFRDQALQAEENRTTQLSCGGSPISLNSYFGDRRNSLQIMGKSIEEGEDSSENNFSKGNQAQLSPLSR